jgi:hypothetical protein
VEEGRVGEGRGRGRKKNLHSHLYLVLGEINFVRVVSIGHESTCSRIKKKKKNSADLRNKKRPSTINSLQIPISCKKKITRDQKKLLVTNNFKLANLCKPLVFKTL